jgi:hypothetical protein
VSRFMYPRARAGSRHSLAILLGALGGRSPEGVIPTPDQSGVMILRLARTPSLDLRQLLTIEAHPARIW